MIRWRFHFASSLPPPYFILRGLQRIAAAATPIFSFRRFLSSAELHAGREPLPLSSEMRCRRQPFSLAAIDESAI